MYTIIVCCDIFTRLSGIFAVFNTSLKFVGCYLIAYIYRHQPDQHSEDDVPSPSKPSKVIVGIDVDTLNYTRT